ncbi:unnamed protein product, partial [Polarella glacialis]
AMQPGPIAWDSIHAHHNPFTGSFHSPPGSGLLGWSSFEGEDQLRGASSPARLFPSLAELASKPREISSQECFNPFQFLCSFCCPASADRDKEVVVK